MYRIQLISSATSVPGRTGSQASALAASAVSRGSTTTVLTPFSRRSTTAPPPLAGQDQPGSVPQSTRVLMGVSNVS